MPCNTAASDRCSSWMIRMASIFTPSWGQLRDWAATLGNRRPEDFTAPVPRRLTVIVQAFLTQALHQPFALTNLPPKRLQEPSASPGFPEYKLQLPHTALLSLRLLALF